MTKLWDAPTVSTPISATVRIPGSKSLTNRWLVLAALADGPCTISHGLVARDSELMIGAISALGAQVERTQTSWVITPGELRGPAEVDCGLAGTVMRFVPPIAALAQGDIRFDGDPRARVRPMKTVIEALKSLGVDIDDDNRGTLPFTVHGSGEVTQRTVTIDASASSQFVSALLLAGARFNDGIEVFHRGASLPSLPHIEMTLETLRQCGVEVDRGPLGENEYRWAVKPGPIKAFNITVEPDLSNAAAFVAAAMATGGQVRIPDWPTSTHQAGDQLRVLLAQMGAQVQRDGNDMVFRGTGEIRGLDADLHDVGELTPVIAALCALASTPSSLRGIAHLRGHETDRLVALATEINRLGGQVIETQDGLEITPAPLHGGVFETYEDHRMAMAGVVIALAVPGVQIENIETTSKTMPDFAQMWLDMIGHNA